jgi:hypothetical protein
MAGCITLAIFMNLTGMDLNRAEDSEAADFMAVSAAAGVSTAAEEDAVKYFLDLGVSTKGSH